MSSFRRRIRELGRVARGNVGFSAARANEPSRHVLVAVEVTAANAMAAIDAGADILLAAPDALKAAVKAAAARPVGARLDAATTESVAAATKSGADFFVFDDAVTQASALLPIGDSAAAAELGRVLRLGDERADERLRTIATLNLDALLVDGLSATMTVREQIALRRVADLTGVPMIAVATEAPTATTLQIWRDAGAPIVLVQGDPSIVGATAEAAARVPPPRRPRDEQRPALVPQLTGTPMDDDPR